MLELLMDPEAWVSLLVLSAMEIVLGIDNIVFITILAGRLPPDQQAGARRLGLAVALVSRLVLLAAIAWVMRLTEPLFFLFVEWSGKDLILLGGGLFLLYKATHEIYENVERPDEHQPQAVAPQMAQNAERSSRKLYFSLMSQVILLDLVFSLDSVITAIGMAKHIPIMVAAMLIAVGVMMAFAGPLGDFVQKHPSMRILALAFLILIGVMLIVESTGQHVSKGYIYAAMAFSLLVELLNLRRRSRAQRLTAHAVTA
ncbi:MAG: TerC family protein [Deltaproteobacteria bacterium]|nr:TerC family protein [Deltaproteobacteria bacterium]